MEPQALLKRFIRFFLNGLLFLLPIAITVYLIVSVVAWINEKVIVPLGLPSWGIGFLIVILGVAGVGLLVSSFLFNPIRNQFESWVNKIPLVKTIYSSISDLLSAFVGEKKRFTKPVLVKFSKDSDLEKLGFITDEDLSEFSIAENKIAVYLPHSYAFSGNLYIVPRENVTLLDKNPSDIMKYIVSGGVVEIEENLEEPKS